MSNPPSRYTLKKVVTTETQEKGLWSSSDHPFVWKMNPKDLLSVFHRPVYREILAQPIFQRLSRISFLGAIDFVWPGRRRASNSRFQHTLGVARLGLRFAEKAGLNERQEQLLVLAGLLHDIGHAPLSHSLESVFQKHFGLGHHEATASIIRGETSLGKGILNSLRAAAFDPEEVIALISGKHDSVAAPLFASPMNIDTFEGILRCRLYMRLPMALNPESLVDGFLSLDSRAEQRFDCFWKAKQHAYEYLINGAFGVFADALAKNYMLENISAFSLQDHFFCERQLFRKHPKLAGILRQAKQLFGASEKRNISIKKRIFYSDNSFPIRTHSDLFLRYLQQRSDVSVAIPSSLMEHRRAEQSCLFDSTCEQ